VLKTEINPELVPQVVRTYVGNNLRPTSEMCTKALQVLLLLAASCVCCAEARPARVLGTVTAVVAKGVVSTRSSVVTNGTALAAAACPVGEVQCSDLNGDCCPRGTFCGSGRFSDECYTCSTGYFLCANSEKCCPNGNTCGSGSQCIASPTSTLTTWAIALIVVLPISLIVSGILAYNRRKAARAAEASSTFVTMASVPMTNPLVYNGASTYQASAPPPSSPGGTTHDWRPK
jgi:hypothetical protein